MSGNHEIAANAAVKSKAFAFGEIERFTLGEMKSTHPAFSRISPPRAISPAKRISPTRQGGFS